MQTDEQFAQDLAQAFRATTADLRYGGRVPKPSRPSLVIAPAVAAGVAGVALAVVATSHDGHTHAATQAGPLHQAVQPGHTVQAQPRITAKQVEIHKLKLEGYSLNAGGPGVSGYYAKVVDAVPSSAQPADDDAAGVKAYVGVDPTTGLQTAYVENSTRIIAITSPDSTTVQLKVMLGGGYPQSVPLVTSGN